MDALRQQVLYTLRKLLRAPMFSTIAVLTLAVGIGSNAAIFSVVNGVLLKPLPFHEPERLVGIWHEAPGLGFSRVNQSPALHFTYLEDNRSFESVGMGAERADVTRMVLRQAGALAAGGVVIGLLAAAGLTRLMSALLYGVDPLDPLTFGAVALGLSVIALVASWIPARRAANVHPVVALRFD